MKFRWRLGIALILLSAGVPTYAAYNATVVGTVGIIQQMATTMSNSPETVIFTLSSPPASGATAGCGNPYFVFSPNSVTDGQTRKNYLAMILQSKATGGTIQVGYDSTGGFCDQGFIAIYWLEIL